MMADRRISKTKNLCDSGMPVRSGNIGNDRTAKTEAASMRKQLGTKNSKSNDGRQKKNGETGVQRSLRERDW